MVSANVMTRGCERAFCVRGLPFVSWRASAERPVASASSVHDRAELDDCSKSRLAFDDGLKSALESDDGTQKASMKSSWSWAVLYTSISAFISIWSTEGKGLDPGVEFGLSYREDGDSEGVLRVSASCPMPVTRWRGVRLAMLMSSGPVGHAVMSKPAEMSKLARASCSN